MGSTTQPTCLPLAEHSSVGGPFDLEESSTPQHKGRMNSDGETFRILLAPKKITTSESTSVSSGNTETRR